MAFNQTSAFMAIDEFPSLLSLILQVITEDITCTSGMQFCLLQFCMVLLHCKCSILFHSPFVTVYSFYILQEFPLFKELVFSSENLILMKPPGGTFAIIGVDRKGFVCHSCKYGRHSCDHITSLTDAIAKNNAYLPDFLVEMVASRDELQSSSVKSVEVEAASKGKFSWVTTAKQRRIYSLGRDSSGNLLSGGSVELFPNEDPCDQCGGAMALSERADKRRLFLWADIIEVTGMVLGDFETMFMLWR